MNSELNAEIARAERAAIGMAMTGQWTPEEEAKLSALYDARRALVPRAAPDDQETRHETTE